MYFSCNKNGFSLLELLMSLTILAMITVFAVPRFHDLQARQEFSHLQRLMQYQINIARSHALTLNSNIVMCSSDNLMRCQNQQWHQGIIIYVDSNQNGQLDSAEQILSQTTTQLKYGSLTWHGNASHPNQLVFQSDSGLPRGSNGSFRYCSAEHQEYSKDLSISMMGHLRTIALSQCN